MKIPSHFILTLGACLCGTTAEMSRGQDTWSSVFSYCQQTDWRFDAEGKPTTNAPTPLAMGAVAPPLDSNERAAFHASNGNGSNAKAFLTWLDSERDIPGECVIVAGVDKRSVFVISEHGVESRCLKRYDMVSRKANALTLANCQGRELVGPTFVFEGHEEARLVGLVWRSLNGIETEWYDTSIAEIVKRLKKELGANGVEFLCHSPTNVRHWIVTARFRDKPPTWLSVDADTQRWRILQEFRKSIRPTRRESFQYSASDGTGLCAVFTRPEGTGPFPLIVFPHGGPGAMTTTDFDERVWALCDAGFAVFQPNYRGSAGFGKKFRFDGWGAEGIKRAMLDIKEGVDALRRNRDCPIADCRPSLLGGSWGGYCVLEQLAMFPGHYAGAVSFFGAFDLPGLLEGEIQKTSASGKSDARIERRSLVRQFGDPDNADDLTALASISPINQLDCIAEPVVLLHNREDKVIPFSQSEHLYSAMTNNAMKVAFLVGNGGHGFLADEEAAIYKMLITKLRQWCFAP